MEGHNGNVFDSFFFLSILKEKIAKTANALREKCTTSAFPWMTIMSDESPRQILPGSYNKLRLIRGAKSKVTLTSPCATLTFQSKETARWAFYAL